MRTGACWMCGRRRPWKRLQWNRGEPAMCNQDAERDSCRRAVQRMEAFICRLILSDSGQKDRKGWREELGRHRRLAR